MRCYRQYLRRSLYYPMIVAALTFVIRQRAAKRNPRPPDLGRGWRPKDRRRLSRISWVAKANGFQRLPQAHPCPCFFSQSLPGDEKLLSGLEVRV